MHLHVVGADGTGQRRLTEVEGGYAGPSWSPDGKQIALTCLLGKHRGLCVIDADKAATPSPVPFATWGHIGLGAASWLPDGSRIAYGAEHQQPRIADLARSSIRMLDLGSVESAPAWSPDSNRIAFVREVDHGGERDSEIFVARADGTDVRRLTDHPAEDAMPTWSPDGTTIAFVSNRYGNSEIYVVDAGGGNPVRLTDNVELDTAPSWSPIVKR
jgi:TolB protein